MTTTVKDSIVNALFGDGVRNTFTVSQARARFGVSNVAARIHELRKDGFAIYTNTKTLEDGRTISFYRAGTPSVRYSRNLNAGRTQIALKSLYNAA